MEKVSLKKQGAGDIFYYLHIHLSGSVLVKIDKIAHLYDLQPTKISPSAPPIMFLHKTSTFEKLLVVIIEIIFIDN